MKNYIINNLGSFWANTKQTTMFVNQQVYHSLKDISFYGTDDKQVDSSTVCVWKVTRKVIPFKNDQHEPYVFAGLTLHSVN